MKNLIHFFIITFLFICSNAFSVPAKRVLTPVTQPDGTVVNTYLVGDENLNFKTTVDGYPVILSSDDYLYFALFNEDGELEATSYKALNPEDRDEQLSNFIQTIDLKEQFRAVSRSKTSLVQRSKSAFSINSPQAASKSNTGSQRVLVILAAFSDIDFTIADPQQAFYRMLNEEGYSDNGATGSARDYFIANSTNTYFPQFDVIGPITLPNTMAYYGNNQTGDTRNMMRDICAIINDDVDFSVYDNDGDGYIESVYVFHSGYGEAEGGPADAIWAHAWWLGEKYDGVTLGNYATSQELRGASGSTMVGIGTFCHEFSHVLGLKDYYCTGSENCFTLGEWDLMDTGSYNNNGRTPPNHNAYSRYALGWLEPTELNPSDTTVTLNNLTDNEAYIIRTSRSNEYFILENRQKTGNDKYIPGHGMLIWHIDYDADVWWSNQVNNDPDHQRVDIVEADDIKTWDTRAADAFPGTASVKTFSHETSPAFVMHNGTSLNKVIRNIIERRSIISFDYGEWFADPEIPVINNISNVTRDGFTVTWLSVPLADNYEIDVYRKNALGGSVYVSGFKAAKTGLVNSCSVSGLNADTQYYCQIRACRSYKTGASSEAGTFKTLSEGFDGEKPEIFAITEESEGSFKIEWSEVENANSYYLNLLEIAETGINETVCDFTDRANGIPESWSTNSSLFSGSYFGEATPSIRLGVDQAYLQTEISDVPLTSFGFWYYAIGSSETCKIIVQGFNGAYWIGVDTIVDFGNRNIYLIDSFNDTYYGARILIEKDRSGNLYLDDVKATYAGTTLAEVDGYTEKNLGSVNSVIVDNLKAGATYQAYLKAHDGETFSADSEPAIFTVKGTSTEIGRAHV